MQMKPKPRRRWRTEWIAAVSFVTAIALGTILLSLPAANRSGDMLNPLTALFTATSATCVTGLSLVNIGTAFTHFGQIVILLLIQLGGLGIMTLSTFMLVLLGSKLSLQNEFVLMDALGAERARGLKPLIAITVLFSLLTEAVAAVIIAARLVSHHGFSASRAAYHGIFHSVSSFCNAGFSLYPDSLTQFRADPCIMLTLSALIVGGGLGFIVLFNLFSWRPWRRNRKRRGLLSLHTKIVIAASASLLLAGWLIFFLLERNSTLAGLGTTEKILCSLFQSITPRTAGFNVVDTASLTASSKFLTMLMMLVGGSPGSTAGGLKTTTLIVMIMVVISMIRGREDVEIMSRSISARAVREAISICTLGIFLVLTMYGLMLLTEHSTEQSNIAAHSEALLFETISAFGTVGLSTGITPHISSPGQLLLICSMFIGRLGPLTIALIIGNRIPKPGLRYPEEEIVVG